MLKPAHLILAAASCLFGVNEARAQAPLSTAFTYRGELVASGINVTGTYDIRFRLYDAASGGNQVGSTLCSDNLDVALGRFSLSLDFGAVFNGQQRYLEIEVRDDPGLDCSDASGFTVLSPRQLLSATPQASYAATATSAEIADTAQTATDASTLGGNPPAFYLNAANLTGALPTGRLSGIYSSPLTLNNPLNVFAGNGASLINLSATNISSGVLSAARMPTNWAAGGDLTGFYPNPTIGGNKVTVDKLEPAARAVLTQLSSAQEISGPNDPIGWGYNEFGQTATPALPSGLTYTAISAGYSHSLGLRSDGSVVAWGISAPWTQVPALPAGLTYTAVSAGFSNSLALRSDGSVITWPGTSQAPTLPPGVRYTAIATGAGPSLALTSIGTVVTWGDCGSGQCAIPALPAGMTYTAMAGGADHTLVLRSDGSVFALGANAFGQLNVPALPSGQRYTAIAAGTFFSYALRSDGTITAWGRNVSGILNPPALPAGMTYTHIAGGATVGAAIRSDGQLIAWGENELGQLNVPALPPGSRYTSVSIRHSHIYAGRSVFSPSLVGSSGLRIGTTAAPAAGGISVAGASSFASSLTAASLIGSTASITDLTSTTISTSRLTVRNGIIQLGATPVTGTNDLGLYSSLGSVRFVTNNSQFAWYTDGGSAGGNAGAGTTPRMTLSATGNLAVTGSLSKGGGSFKIDHPLDPANKYLYHSFVESPDMMNIYNGVVTTGPDGMATVTLPDYFEALNRDFRYQLTVIDESNFALVRVSRRIEGNTFEITSSTPGIEVSWEVTGVRKDAWAERNRIPNSVDKVGDEKGKYLHPEAFEKATTPSGAAD
jgi:hypothetical protein